MLRGRKSHGRQARSRACAHTKSTVVLAVRFDIDLLAGSSALGDHHSTNHKVWKIHLQLACKINVFSDVYMQVDEGGQAVFFQVASGQSVSPGRSEELNF